MRPSLHAEAGFILRHTAQHQGLVTTGWKLLCVLASLSVGEQAGGRTAFPPHQCRKPRPGEDVEKIAVSDWPGQPVRQRLFLTH